MTDFTVEFVTELSVFVLFLWTEILVFETNVKFLFFTILIRAQEMRMVHHPKCRKTLFVITVTELLGVDTT